MTSAVALDCDCETCWMVWAQDEVAAGRAGKKWYVAERWRLFGVPVTNASPRMVDKECHYCGRPATTRDHVVPRLLLQGRTEYLDPYALMRNVVPCCAECNRQKGSQRSWCDCRQCREAWTALGPSGWSELPRRDVGFKRGRS